MQDFYFRQANCKFKCKFKPATEAMQEAIMLTSACNDLLLYMIYKAGRPVSNRNAFLYSITRAGYYGVFFFSPIYFYQSLFSFVTLLFVTNIVLDVSPNLLTLVRQQVR
jgi:hypothetical protein